MDFSLDDEQQLIAETASRFLAEASDSRAMRAASESAGGTDHGLWRGIAELGWCGVHLPDEVGGLGLGIVELALLQEQLGRRLACVPFFDSVVLAATVLREIGAARLLPDLASGERIATLALDTRDGIGEPSARATLLADGSWQLDGGWPQVGSATVADWLLLPALAESGEWLLFATAARENPAVGVTPLATLDLTRRAASVRARAAVLPASACIARGPALRSALQRGLNLAAIALAAEQLGGAQQCLDLTVAYAGERVQFGQPIARFQAVKHRCAQMLVAVVGARSAVYGAACVADAAPDPATLEFHAALARCEAAEAARFCAQEAIQLHGGIGFTWELDLHWYFKRAQASSQRLGPPSWWRERVAAQLLNDPPGAAP